MSNAIQGLPQGNAGFVRSDATTATRNGASGDSEFMNTLRNAMDQVGQLQSEADGKVAQLLTGNGQDVHSAMIAVEKASLRCNDRRRPSRPAGFSATTASRPARDGGAPGGDPTRRSD